MQDLMRAIRYIRKHAEELHVEKDKIMLCGFSAGAHACGSVAVHWQEFENLRRVSMHLSQQNQMR